MRERGTNTDAFISIGQEDAGYPNIVLVEGHDILRGETVMLGKCSVYRRSGRM